MVNVYFNCNLVDPWLEVAQSVPDINVVYWMAYKGDPELQKLKTERFDKTYIQYWEDAWHGNGYPDDLNLESVNRVMLEKYAPYELIALQMLDRMDADRHSFSYLERRRYFRFLISAAHAIIKKYKIELVISPSVPHRIHDYALYAVCRGQGIPFIMFQGTSFKSHAFVIDDVDNIPDWIKTINFSPSPGNSELKPDIKTKIELLSRSGSYIAPDYMVKQTAAMSKRSGFKGAIQRIREFIYLLRFKTKKPAKIKLKNNTVHRQYYSNWDNALVYLRRLTALYRLQKDYQKWVNKRPVRDRPFVLIALHYQPEETTAPSGGTYADQTLIAELLNSALDNDIDIVIKEHKSQFNDYGPWKGERGRLPEDYAHFARISERVRFVSEHEDPFELIGSALAIATVTGTIGHESALLGTPTLFFGRAWFEGMPRTYRVTTACALRTDWPAIVAAKSADLKSETETYHRNLQNFLIFASHYRNTKAKPLIKTELSVKNLISGLAQYGEHTEDALVRSRLEPFIIAKKMRREQQELSSSNN